MSIQRVLHEIEEKFSSGAVHTFLLHLNVSDSFLGEDQSPKDLKEILISDSVLSQACFVAFFNLATGITFVDRNMEDSFRSFLSSYDAEEAKRFDLNRDDIGYALRLFMRLLSTSKEMAQDHLGEKRDKKFKDKTFFLAVYLKYAETLVPPDSASNKDSDRMVLTALLEIASSTVIRRSGNILVIAAESLGSVAPQLSKETSGVLPIKLSLPNDDERIALLNYIDKNHKGVLGEIDARHFSRNSSGLSTNKIVQMARVSTYRQKPIVVDELFEEKKKFIDDASGGLLEIQRPLWGLEAIGSLEEYKRYITETVRNMKKGTTAAVPTGILLLGAPGTGKTVFVEALAYEAGIPVIVMKNTRNMFVGQSERNMEFSIEIIRATAPNIVFLDEIDQQLVKRGSYSGDSGVTQRIQARLFEVMSDTNLRGRVLWISASNRPDLIDGAMLREGRFDAKIPFFPLGSTQRVDILKALFRKNQILSKKLNTGFSMAKDLEDEDFLGKFARMTHCHVDNISSSDGRNNKRVRKCNYQEDHDIDLDEKEDELFFTGAQLEYLVSEAFRLASGEGVSLGQRHMLAAFSDYIPPASMIDYDSMSELAISFSNSHRFIPKSGRWAKLARGLGIVSKNDQPRVDEKTIEFDND